jgi:AcrR family transcriptional regulator
MLVTTTQSGGNGAGATGPVAKQRRSQITYNSLIETGFRLLETRDFDSVSIAEIAKEAGYSVGAFYARFENKEEFFRAMVDRHNAERRKGIERFFRGTKPEDLVAKYVRTMVKRIWRTRFFWRAALRRSLDDQNFWEPFRQLSHLVADKFIDAKAASIGRKLTRTEEMNIRFGLQIVLGTINNSITNRPGPLMLEHHDFQKRLIEAFQLISHYDAIR